MRKLPEKRKFSTSFLKRHCYKEMFPFILAKLKREQQERSGGTNDLGQQYQQVHQTETCMAMRKGELPVFRLTIQA